MKSLVCISGIIHQNDLVETIKVIVLSLNGMGEMYYCFRSLELIGYQDEKTLRPIIYNCVSSCDNPITWGKLK